MFSIFNAILRTPHLLKPGFSYFNEQRKEYFADKEKLKPLNQFLSLSINGLLGFKYLNSDLDLNNSLLYFRFQEFPLQLYWLMYSISSGAIHPAIREIRFILESWARANYMDEKHPNLSLLQKRDKQSKINFKNYYKKGKIVKEGSVNLLPKNTRESSIKLWDDVNKYSHPDPEELERIDKITSENVEKFLFNYGNKSKEDVIGFLSILTDIFLEITGFNTLLQETNLEWSREIFKNSMNEPVFKKMGEFPDLNRNKE